MAYTSEADLFHYHHTKPEQVDNLTPMQKAIFILGEEIEKQKKYLPTDLSARNWADALNLAQGILIQRLPEEKKQIVDAYDCGRGSILCQLSFFDSSWKITTGQDYFNNTYKK